jgi:two-component system response regulator FixJ
MRSVPLLKATQPSLILLVDDNPHGMLARAAVLRSLGYEVTTAASAEEALELAGARAVDLVVTDFRMPEMDGKQLIAALRARGFTMPVILLSGFADKLGFDEESTGANLVIQKSANEVTVLASAIKRLLGSTRKPPASAPGGSGKRSAAAE